MINTYLSVAILVLVAATGLVHTDSRSECSDALKKTKTEVCLFPNLTDIRWKALSKSLAPERLRHWLDNMCDTACFWDMQSAHKEYYNACASLHASDAHAQKIALVVDFSYRLEIAEVCAKEPGKLEYLIEKHLENWPNYDENTLDPLANARRLWLTTGGGVSIPNFLRTKVSTLSKACSERAAIIESRKIGALIQIMEDLGQRENLVAAVDVKTLSTWLQSAQSLSNQNCPNEQRTPVNPIAGWKVFTTPTSSGSKEPKPSSPNEPADPVLGDSTPNTPAGGRHDGSPDTTGTPSSANRQNKPNPSHSGGTGGRVYFGPVGNLQSTVLAAAIFLAALLL